MAETRTERSIIFSADMVRAIMDGKKTQTRRVIKPQPRYGLFREPMWSLWKNGVWADGYGLQLRCLYGVVGDQLWVKETWATAGNWDEYKPSELLDHWFSLSQLRYKATEKFPDGEYFTWRPSIFMPRWASRIQLEIKGVRVEQLREITEEDAIAEGVGFGFQMNAGWPDYRYINTRGICELTQDSVVMSFSTLWDSIYKKRGFGWDVNPWVWVVEFARVER